MKTVNAVYFRSILLLVVQASLKNPANKAKKTLVCF